MAAGGPAEASAAGLWPGLRDSAQHYCGLAWEAARRAVGSLPEDMRPGPDLYGFSWDIVIRAGIVGAFTVLLFLYRSYQSVAVRVLREYAECLNALS